MTRSASPTLVLVSGIFGLILCLGVARFAYTPMLPYMQVQTGLGDGLAGWLAGWNYLGYLSGVLLVTRLKDMVLKDQLYRWGLVLAVLTTAMMGMAEDPVVWGVSRYLAGLSSAAGLMLGSGLILHWLMRHGHRSELGLHFSGLGIGIVVGGLAVESAAQSMNWAEQWWVLTALGAALLVPAWLWLPSPKEGPALGKQQAQQAGEPSRLWLVLLQAAYLCAGFGYVISATFMVVITEQAPELQGQGGLMWLIAGMAAAPATLAWDRVARRIGYIASLQSAFVLQIIGIILPVLSDSFWAAVVSGALFGWTFIGIVSLVLTMVGIRYPSHPAAIMAKLTLGYSVAQILGPVLAGEAAEATGSFDGSLLLVAAIMVVGLGCLTYMSRLKETQQTREG